MVAILTVIVTAQAIQYSIVSLKLSQLAQCNTSLLKNNEESFARNIHLTIESGISGSLERGEMEKFNCLVKDLKRIDGLSEFSLFNDAGVATYSSHDAFLKRQIPSEINGKLKNDKTMLVFWQEKTIDIYTPQLINADCIRCHMQYKVGDIFGITLFRFSTEKLLNANILSKQAIYDTKRSFLFTSVAACILLLTILSATITIVVRLVITNPLDAMGRKVKEITSGDFDLTIRLNENKKDKIGEFSRFVNLLLSKLHEMIAATAAMPTTHSG